MPDPFERHSKSRWEWGTAAPRSQQRAAAADDDPLKERVPGKKDKNACKAAHGGPHVPVLMLDGNTECCWDPMWVSRSGEIEPGWRCHHRERCQNCGKHFRYGFQLRPEECPLYSPEIPPEVWEECQERELRRSKWMVRRQPRPPITGPQGYRKRKAGR